MKANELRSFIQIQEQVQTKDKYGAVSVTWQKFADAWAKIENLRGYDKVAASANWPGANYKITIRYVDGLLPTMRVVYRNQIYSILGQPNNIYMRDRYLELTCQSGEKAQ